MREHNHDDPIPTIPGLEAGGILKMVVSAIPGIGSVLSGLMSDDLAMRRFERVEDVVRALSKRIALLEQVDPEYLNSEDPVLIAEACFERAVHERMAKKRDLLGGVLANATAARTSYSDFEKHRVLRLLEDLHPVDIEVLRAVAVDPQTESAAKHGNSPRQTLRRRTGFSEQEVDEVSQRLTSIGLADLAVTVVMMSNAADLRGRLTPLGRAFLTYLSD